MKNFYMARHGLTDWNLENKVQGATDIPLNEGGIKQAYALAENIIKSGAKIHKILCSPLSRAYETARIVSEKTGIPLQIEPRLIEQNFGKWEGWKKTGNDNSFHLAKQQFMDCYEGGESMFRLAQRIYNFLDELKNLDSEETYLLVTHGGIARVVQSYFTDMTNEEFASYFIHNCEIKEFKF
ncbi:MAG: histidine phosphatase family protein [Treponema sp.]|nr:histidine phosphatase family protein [Treponema sp.]